MIALMREGLGYEEEEEEDEFDELLLLEAGHHAESDAAVREWEWVPLKASQPPPTHPGY